MNASGWRKAADLVAQGTQANQQAQAAATAESNQLESLPLSALSADDSSPPQVIYGPEQSLATSTPRATLTSTPEMQTTETYRQIIPGMSDRLYRTLVADGSLSTRVADNRGTLQNQITSEVGKYLQEVAERCERDVNYFDGWHMATNTSSPQQKVHFIEQNEEHDEERYWSQMVMTPARRAPTIQNTTFNIKTSWKPFKKKKKTKIHKWQKNKT